MWRIVIILGLLLFVPPAAADPPPDPDDSDPIGTPGVSLSLPVGDAVLRRTDIGADGLVEDIVPHRIPDIIGLEMGNWAPLDPFANAYEGEWTAGGAFFRLDLWFDGLINPPGLLLRPSTISMFDPYRYGPNPVFGFIEFDVDANVATGGETATPGERYLANVARFGGKPAAPRFADRVALSGSAAASPFDFPPYVQRSGEEFHIALLGEHIASIAELAGNGDALFGEGETWLVRGPLFHRAHGFEEFSFAVGPPLGAYEPQVELRWRHRPDGHCTQVTLVYPLTNAAWLLRQGIPPDDNVILNNDASDQNSIHEGLTELVFSAAHTPPAQRLDLHWPIIAHWEPQAPTNYLVADNWAVTVLVGMSYAQLESDGARFVWTDVVDGVVVGDVNGDGEADGLDALAIFSYIQINDGDSTVDADSTDNGSVAIIDFGVGFSVYDLNYDGMVDDADLFSIVILGDLDLDLDVDLDDVDDFVSTLLAPQSGPTAPDPRLIKRGDFTRDGTLDGRDIAGFVRKLGGGG